MEFDYNSQYNRISTGTQIKDAKEKTCSVFYTFSPFTFQMFRLAKNVRSTRHTWVPALQRCFSAVEPAFALSHHKQVRTMECQNGEKVDSYCKVMKLTILITFDLISPKLCTVQIWTEPCRIYRHHWAGLFGKPEPRISGKVTFG